VQRDRQFDHAEPGAEVAAGHGNGADRLGAQFIDELLQFAFRQFAQIRRRADGIEKRGVRSGQVYASAGVAAKAAARARRLYPKSPP